MATVAQMLWRIETTTIPIRIDKIDLTPTKEGRDDLTLQLTVSTLTRLDPNPNAARPINATADARGGRL
jgi:hypothetical protein